MNTSPFRTLAAGPGLALLLASSAFGVQYGPQRFAVEDGTTDLADGTTIASSDGTASVQAGVLQLTADGVADTRSSFRIPALAESAQGWTASFEFVIADDPGDGLPADGFSFNYGAIPAFNPGQADPTAADAHGQGEEGWHPSVSHLAFEIDTFANSAAEDGFAISMNGTDAAFLNQNIIADGQLVVGSAILSWSPTDGASMSVDLGEGLNSIFSNVPTPGFTGSNAYSFAFSARTGGSTQTVTVDNVQVTTIPPGFVVLPNPIISEFMADNANTIEDEDCRSSDWIELFNATANPINLSGWYLTDNPATLAKWRIPDLPLVANGRKLIFASGKDQKIGELHTDFALNKDGGFVALVKPDGVTIASAYTYGPQVTDISYGSLGQAQTIGAFGTATPGAPNVAPQGNLLLDKPDFSLESQVITDPVSLELSTDVPDAEIRYVIATTDINNRPVNVGVEPTPSSPLYTDPIPISKSARVTARLFVPGKEPGPVRDRTFIKLNTDMLNVASEIPIIIIDSFGFNIDGESASDSSNPRRPVHAIFIDLNPLTSRARATDLPDFEGRGGMRVRGQTSAGFDKKQYAFETWDSEGNDKDVSIFGFPSESDWVIHAPYSDKTLMRNKIVYDTSREMGWPASRTRFCELYFNSNGGDVSATPSGPDYRGVYVFMEKIKRNEDRVNIKKLETCDNSTGKITGGYIFKKDKGATNYPMSTVREGHTMSFVEPDAPTPAQRAWLDRHLDDFENVLHNNAIFADPTRGYRNYLNVRSFIDTHIWVEVYKNIDGYRLSSYFHKDRGRKILASPVWDYNLSLGNANYLAGETPQGWYYTQLGAGDYPWYTRLFMDPEFEIEYWDRWFELRTGILASNQLLGRITSYQREIARPASRNFQRWPVLGTYLWPNASGYQTRVTHADEVQWMRTWLSSRLIWIDAQHANPPKFTFPDGLAFPGGPIAAGQSLTIANPNAGGGTLYFTTDGSDPRLRGGGLSATAQIYSAPLALDSSMTIRSRVRTGAAWSPVRTDSFLVGGELASATNLAVTELNYRPAAFTTSEAARGFDVRTDFEFAEIMNIGAVAIDLAGVRFTGGIEFDFNIGEVRWLAPGERAVVVSNRDAFQLRYFAQLSGMRIAGEFRNNLSNDGETIAIVDAAGDAIRTFTYNDKNPWPEAADGDGPSLVLINPRGNPDHNNPLNWRSSLTPGGTPGQSDGSLFAGDPAGDDDQNGINNLLQYGLAPSGVSPLLPTTGIGTFTVEAGTDQFMTLTYTRNIGADDVRLAAQVSEDLVTWRDDSEDIFTVVSRVENANGTETISLRLNEPVTATQTLFGRLSVELRTP